MGSITGVATGVTRSVDYSSHELLMLLLEVLRNIVYPHVQFPLLLVCGAV